jgi:hypothetical protein
MPDDHVRVNRDSWDEDAANWVERGREAWALEEPVWGRGNPESEVHLLSDVSGLDAIELHTQAQGGGGDGGLKHHHQTSEPPASVGSFVVSR